MCAAGVQGPGHRDCEGDTSGAHPRPTPHHRFPRSITGIQCGRLQESGSQHCILYFIYQIVK